MMKKTPILIIICLLLILDLSCKKQEPSAAVANQYSLIPILTDPIPIIDKEKQMWSGRTACPEMVDWNNDGKRDLLVGMFSKGQVMLFLNTGADSAPRFESGELLTAGGEEIHVEYG